MLEASIPTLISKKTDWSIMGLVGVAHATSHFSHLLIPSLFPLYAADLDLSYANLALLMGVYFVFSGVCQFISGFLVDRFGSEKVLFGALGLLCLGALTLSIATHLPILVLASVFLGVGNSAFHPVDYSILNQRISIQRIGAAYSSHSIFGTLGWAITPVSLSFISQWFHWRIAYLVSAVVFAGVLLLCYTFRHLLKIHKAPATTEHKPTLALSLAFLKLPPVWRSFGYFAFSMAALSFVQNFAIPVFHKDLFDLSYAQAAGIVSTYMVCSATGIILGGLMLHKLLDDHVKILTITISSLAGIFFILALAEWSVQTFTTLLLLGSFIAGIGSPFRDLYIKKATPANMAGKVYGFIYSGLDVGAAAFPWIFALFLDHGMVRTTLMVVGLALLLAVLCVVPVKTFLNSNRVKKYLVS